MRYALRLGLLAFAFALATAAFGWWTVPLLGVAWPLIAGPAASRAAATAALAAALGWLLLLVWAAAQGPVGLLDAKVGGAMDMPGVVLVFVTLAFPALVAGTGAVAVRWVMTTVNVSPDTEA